jgi:hypothetical protein
MNTPPDEDAVYGEVRMEKLPFGLQFLFYNLLFNGLFLF